MLGREVSAHSLPERKHVLGSFLGEGADERHGEREWNQKTIRYRNVILIKWVTENETASHQWLVNLPHLLTGYGRQLQLWISRLLPAAIRMSLSAPIEAALVQNLAWTKCM
jgi:hypothetical protein